MSQKKVLICGASGFIGHYLVKKYKKEGHWVCGVSRNSPQYEASLAHEFILADLKDPGALEKVFQKGPFDEVCQCAATIGGAQFIEAHSAQILRDSTLIHLNVLEMCRKRGVAKILYPSSACVYPIPSSETCLSSKYSETSVYPANPYTEYGWEKIFGERVCMAYQKKYGLDIRIARLFSVFGPLSPWDGGKEKAPSALCRKIALAKEGDFIEVFGSGEQKRAFLSIDDCVEGLWRIMQAPGPLPILNLGSETQISMNQLALLIADIAKKKIKIKNIGAQIGFHEMTSDNRLLYETLHWKPEENIRDGLENLYFWIEGKLI